MSDRAGLELITRSRTSCDYNAIVSVIIYIIIHIVYIVVDVVNVIISIVINVLCKHKESGAKEEEMRETHFGRGSFEARVCSSEGVFFGMVF